MVHVVHGMVDSRDLSASIVYLLISRIRKQTVLGSLGASTMVLRGIAKLFDCL